MSEPTLGMIWVAGVPVACAATLATISAVGQRAPERYSASGLTICLVLFLVGAMLRTTYAFVTPDYYAPDEHSHVNFVRYLAREWTLPVQKNLTGSPGNDWEYYQPPLYYTIVAAIKAALASSHQTPNDVLIGRLVSILFWATSTAVTARTLLHIKAPEWQRLFVVGLHALLPSYITLSSSVNNDNLAILLFSCYILSEIVGPGSKMKTLRSSALIGCIFWTKLTAVVAVFFFLAVRISRIERRDWRPTLLDVALGAAVAAAIWSPLVARNLMVYGSVTAEDIANVPRTWATTAEGFLATMKYISVSFWATAGVYNNIKGNFYFLGSVLTALSTMGWIKYWRHKTKERTAPFFASESFPFYSALGVNFLLVIRFGLKYDQGQGRFLFPMLTAVGLFLSGGIAHLCKARRPKQSTLWLAMLGFILWATSFVFYAMSKAPRQ